MFSVPIEVPAAERARWLAELSGALNEARRLMLLLEHLSHQKPAAKDLYLQIEAALLEVQSLRRSRSLCGRQESDPKWIESDPWRSRQLSAR